VRGFLFGVLISWSVIFLFVMCMGGTSAGRVVGKFSSEAPIEMKVRLSDGSIYTTALDKFVVVKSNMGVHIEVLRPEDHSYTFDDYEVAGTVWRQRRDTADSRMNSYWVPMKPRRR
jgi:hypothetical protein